MLGAKIDVMATIYLVLPPSRVLFACLVCSRNGFAIVHVLYYRKGSTMSHNFAQVMQFVNKLIALAMRWYDSIWGKFYLLEWVAVINNNLCKYTNTTLASGDASTSRTLRRGSGPFKDGRRVLNRREFARGGNETKQEARSVSRDGNGGSPS